MERKMALNLDQYVKAVWAAKDINSKRAAMKDLITNSHAKAETKKLSLFKIESLSMSQLDKFATNYSFSGEGIKVK